MFTYTNDKIFIKQMSRDILILSKLTN